MPLESSYIPANNYDHIGPVFAVMAGLLLLFVGLAAFSAGIRGDYLMAIVIVTITCAIIAVFSPRLCFYGFFYLLAIHNPIDLGIIGLQPYDLAMGLLVVSVTLDVLLRGEFRFRRGLFDRQIVFLMVITWISAVFAYRPSSSIIPCIRIVIIYLAFRMILRLALEIGVEKIVRKFINLVFVLSIMNVIMYLYFGGEQRIFGLPWLAYETYAMIALPMALVFMVYDKKALVRIRYGLMCVVIGMGIFATQSRAPLLAVLTAVPVVLIVTWNRSRKSSLTIIRQRLKTLLVPLMILIVLLILLKGSVLAGAIDRYEQFIESLTDPQGTVALRIVLWTAAWKAFLSDPLTGVGIGNFRIISDLMPHLKLLSVWERISFMSTHNVFLQYLAETGIFGALALLALTRSGLKRAWANANLKLSRQDQAVSMAIFISMFIFATTIFYVREWTWGQGGYILAMIFALTAARYYELAGRETTAGQIAKDS